MVLVEPIYCYLTNHFNGTGRTYILTIYKCSVCKDYATIVASLRTPDKV